MKKIQSKRKDKRKNTFNEIIILTYDIPMKSFVHGNKAQRLTTTIFEVRRHTFYAEDFQTIVSYTSSIDITDRDECIIQFIPNEIFPIIFLDTTKNQIL